MVLMLVNALLALALYLGACSLIDWLSDPPRVRFVYRRR